MTNETLNKKIQIPSLESEDNDDIEEQSVKVETLKEDDLIITKEFVLEKDLKYLKEILFKEDSNGNRYREKIIKAVEELGIENWYKVKGLPTDIGSIWKNRYTGTEESLKKIDFYLWENYLPKNMWNDKEMFEKYKYNPENKTEVVMKICENIARHLSDDYILNTLSDMKKQGDNEDKRFKWFVKTCNSYGSGNFNCDTKGVKVNEPFNETLKWKDVYNICKDLPFKEKEKPKELTCECGKPRMWDINIRDKCVECNHKHFLELFNKAELNEMGYSEEKKKFYSHTTGVQTYDLKFIKGVNEGTLGTRTFPYMVYICDEYGKHKNTLGITEGFRNYLIKELNLIKDDKNENRYNNPLITENKEAYEIKKCDDEIKRLTELIRQQIKIKLEIKEKLDLEYVKTIRKQLDE